MFWKMTMLASVFFAYSWFIGSDDTKSMKKLGEKVYESVCHFAEEHEIRLHVHTPACFAEEE
ncbi:MAG: hypothetical protein AAGI90_01145 [Chlamydiota bacterium]